MGAVLHAAVIHLTPEGLLVQALDTHQSTLVHAAMGSPVTIGGHFCAHVPSVRQAVRSVPARVMVDIEVDRDAFTLKWGRQTHRFPHLALPLKSPPVDFEPCATFIGKDASELLKFCRDTRASTVVFVAERSQPLTIRAKGDLYESTLTLERCRRVITFNDKLISAGPDACEVRCTTRNVLAASKAWQFAKSVIVCVGRGEVLLQYRATQGVVSFLIASAAGVPA